MKNQTATRGIIARIKAHRAAVETYDASVQDSTNSARHIAMQARREQDYRQSGW
jgi:hypothetical protein